MYTGHKLTTHSLRILSAYKIIRTKPQFGLGGEQQREASSAMKMSFEIEYGSMKEIYLGLCMR